MNEPTMRELMARTAEINRANGWREPLDPEIAERLALVMLIDTETAELVEEVRAGNPMGENYYTFYGRRMYRVTDDSGADWTTDDLGRASIPHFPEGNQPVTWTGVGPKPEGVPSELADVVIRAMDIAEKYGIDLPAAITEKLEYNASRGYRHGGKVI